MAVVTALCLQALSTPPERPGEPLTTRRLRQGQSDLEQPAHLGNRQVGERIEARHTQLEQVPPEYRWWVAEHTGRLVGFVVTRPVRMVTQLRSLPKYWLSILILRPSGEVSDRSSSPMPWPTSGSEDFARQPCGCSRATTVLAAFMRQREGLLMVDARARSAPDFSSTKYGTGRSSNTVLYKVELSSTATVHRPLTDPDVARQAIPLWYAYRLLLVLIS